MCKKKQFKYCPSRIDPCMKNIVDFLNRMEIETLACCCGHGRYPLSIIVRTEGGFVYEIRSGVILNRRKKFYKKDKKGYYYIPEISKEKK